MNIIAVLATIILFGLIILVHEGGHFMAARLTGIGVFEFSIGFGPAIVQWKKNGVLYAIRIIPLGGYCRIAGVSLDDDEESDRPDGFDKKNVFARVFVLVAGVLMNVVLALVVFIMIGCFIGRQMNPIVIKEVIAGMPAIKSGLMINDIIVSVNGIKAEDPDSTIKSIVDSGIPIKIAILRGGETKEFMIVPEDVIEMSLDHGLKMVPVHKIGVAMQGEFKTVPINQAVVYGFKDTWQKLRLGYYNIIYLFSGRAKFDEIGGPVVVISESYKASKEIVHGKEGIAFYLERMALFSILIGMFNLLPIPVVDGGRIVIEVFKAIYRKPVDKHKEAMVHLVGFFILLAFMAVITINNIIQISTGKMP